MASHFTFTSAISVMIEKKINALTAHPVFGRKGTLADTLNWLDRNVTSLMTLSGFALDGMTRDDGSPVFTAATSASALVFFVLAMQCLPTLAITRRETGSIKYAALQLGYMSTLAYIVAGTAYQLLRLAGVS